MDTGRPQSASSIGVARSSERRVEQIMKSDLARALSGVEGWLDFEMAWVLHELARDFPASTPHITVIEVGCWKGRSTIALALGLKARGGGKVYAVDPHTGSEQTIYLCGPMDTYDAFIENIKAAGVAEWVEPIRGTSHEARGRFPDRCAHLLILDASREYEAVVGYVDDWMTALADGAIVVFRDPFDIYRALRRDVLRFHSPFRRPTLVDDSTGPCLLLEFQRGKPWAWEDSIALILLALQHFIYATRRAKAFREHMPDWIESMFERMDGSLGRVVSRGRQQEYLDRG